MSSVGRWYRIPDGYPGQPLIERSLHIVALSSFAIAQPLFDLLGRNSTFFAAHRSTGVEILLWTLVMLIPLPACLIGVEAVVGLISKRVLYHLHTIIVSLLGALIMIPPLIRWLDPGLLATVLVAVVVAALIGALYRPINALRSVLSWAAMAPLAFAGWFLLATPTSRIVFDTPVDTGDVAVPSDTPVVLLVLDELSLAGLLTPTGDLNEARFPNFARLAQTSTWYPNATTVHDQTRVAVTSILTGSLPEHAAVPISVDFPDNLFTLLAGSYDLEVQESVTNLCPRDVCDDDAAPNEIAGLGMLVRDSAIAYAHLVTPSEARQRWLPEIDNRWAGFTDDSEPASDPSSGVTLDDIRESTRRDLGARQEHLKWEIFLDRLHNSDRSTLFYLHSLLPHSAWRYLPDGKIYENDFFGDLFEDGSGALWRDDPVYTDQGAQRFLLQTRFVDRQIGRMLDRMGQEDLFDESLLIVVADHGISFEPGMPRRNLSQGANRAEILPIPLFVKYPGQTEPKVDPVKAQTIDILPTIVDVLDIDLDWEIAGTSLSGGELSRASGALVTADGVEHVEIAGHAAATAVAEQLGEVFGPGTDPFDVYGMGEHRGLMGRPVGEQPAISEPVSITASVSHVKGLSEVDKGERVIPARVVGTFSGEPTRRELALALNDRVVGVATAYYFPDADVW
ncbi:MAG: sulfatase-like hydrolase/transferase, partial [Acidimicrobiia bacterium]